LELESEEEEVFGERLLDGQRRLAFKNSGLRKNAPAIEWVSTTYAKT
jgi:hypothetical protein